MIDQCTNCTVRGDIDACMKTPCSQHESWYAKTLRATATKEEFDVLFAEHQKLLGELNAMRAVAKQEQGEPVAFLVYDPRVQSQELYFDDELGDTDCCEITPLYTTPQPKQEHGEPVAYMWPTMDSFASAEDVGSIPNWTDYYTVPLYTTPQQRTWVELTVEEMVDLVRNYRDVPATLVGETEAKLKEKNT